MRRALARWRWAGLGVVWDAANPDPEPLQAVVTPAPQVNLTVIHVAAGAFLNVGGLMIDPRAIPAAPHQQAASTEGPEPTKTHHQ